MNSSQIMVSAKHDTFRRKNVIKRTVPLMTLGLAGFKPAVSPPTFNPHFVILKILVLKQGCRFHQVQRFDAP